MALNQQSRLERRDPLLGKRMAADVTTDNKPVIVLCNAGSLSATDGFLSCMADISGVTLVGESSVGESDRGELRIVLFAHNRTSTHSFVGSHRRLGYDAFARFSLTA